MKQFTTPMPARREREPKMYAVCSFRRACELIESKCGEVFISERYGQGCNKVLILPEAKQELQVITSYGRRSPMNAKEQKLAGYGHFLIDEDDHILVIVKHFIEIQTMNRTAVGAANLGPNGETNPGLDFLQYHSEEFLATEAKYNTDAYGGLVDPFLKLCGGSEFVLEGHTHPDLGVFYSAADRESGAARAASSPVCIFVCDPIRKKMLGSVGSSFEDAEVIVYDRGGASPDTETWQERPLPPADEIAQLASQCFRMRGCLGNMRLYTRLDGKLCMKLKLIVPKVKRGKRE